MQEVLPAVYIPQPEPEPPAHGYPFDPAHGYSLAALLQVPAPPEPEGFAGLWQRARASMERVQPRARFTDTGLGRRGWRLYDLEYRSTDGMRIGGWMTLPESGPVRRGFVLGHGYGGRAGADFHWPFADAALLFPCCRGISRSPNAPISPEVWWHVRHDIDKWDRYILRGCVEDTWLAVTVLLRLFPQVEGRIGYIGGSFGGGVGALALPWEPRVQMAHLRVPTFGHQALRLDLPSEGSAASLIEMAKTHRPMIEQTLRYYDAATAARRIRIPVHCACARWDPFVAPAGQFAVYNALPGPKKLYVLDAGHHPYPREDEQEREILEALEAFFADL